MEYRTLGSSELRVSRICLGSMTWGEQNTEAEAFKQLDYSKERGVNFIDTAELYSIPPSSDTYGQTEKIIGSWFSSRKSRHEVILATKVVGAARRLPWIREGEARLNRTNIEQAVDSSLLRLQTDYIDLYQLHWSNRPTYHFGNSKVDFTKAEKVIEDSALTETLEVLQDLVKAGKIRYIGLSNETAWGTMRYINIAESRSLPKPISIQNEYSLLCRLFDRDLEEISLMEGVELLAWSPLAAGALSGKYLGGAVPEGSRRSLIKGHIHRQTPEADDAIAAYRTIAQTYKLDPCQMAIAFVLSRPFTCSAIIGATNMDQLATNIDAIEVTLSDTCLSDIEKIHRRLALPY